MQQLRRSAKTMQVWALEKLEELYRYVYQVNDENKKLKSEIEELIIQSR
ncbi:MAG: hypothetical protein ABIQ56_03765 [Chitinophagaceae bacterium]